MANLKVLPVGQTLFLVGILSAINAWIDPLMSAEVSSNVVRAAEPKVIRNLTDRQVGFKKHFANSFDSTACNFSMDGMAECSEEFMVKITAR